MIISIEGEEATGKSTFAYTAPLPIVAISLDMGHERAIYGTQFGKHFSGLKIETYKYVPGGKPPTYKGNDITIYTMPTPIQFDNSKLLGYIEQWDYFIRLFGEAMQDPSVATFVVDTMTLLRKNKCDAYLQELQTAGKPRKQLMQTEYGHPDGAIRSLYTFATSYEKNLVATHHLRDHYAPQLNKDGQVEQMPDGTKEVDGVKDTARYADIVLRNEKRAGNLVSKMTKCGPNIGLENMAIPGATWDSVMQLITDAGWNGKPFPRRTPEIITGK